MVPTPDLPVRGDNPHVGQTAQMVGVGRKDGERVEQAREHPLRVSSPEVEDGAQGLELSDGDEGAAVIRGQSRDLALGLIDEDLGFG